MPMLLTGIFLIVIGVLWLLQRLEIITGSFWTYFWPIVLIFVGISFLLGWLRWRRWWGWWGPRRWLDEGENSHRGHRE